MTSLAYTQTDARPEIRTGPPRNDDLVGYVWMAVLGLLMLIGYLSLLVMGGM